MVDARANYWLPVDQYIGGIEHAILHLLYFRFYHKLLRDAGMVHQRRAGDQPAVPGHGDRRDVLSRQRRRHRRTGSIRPMSRSSATSARRVVGAVLKADGKPVQIGGTEKMSKSKNNGVDPQAMVDKYGADTVRLFSMFAAPPEQSLEWNEAGVEGMARFLRRFWREVTTHAAQPGSSGSRSRRTGRRAEGACAGSCTKPSRRSATTSAAATRSTPRSPR